MANNLVIYGKTALVSLRFICYLSFLLVFG